MGLDVRGVAPLIQVFDMPASLRFYRDFLSFEIESTSPPRGGTDRFHWVLLRLGSAELMLNTAYEFDEERPPVPDPVRVESHRDTCLYFGCPDVDAVYAALLSKGLKLNPPQIASYGMKQLALLDPDGYALCFQWPVQVQE